MSNPLRSIPGSMILAVLLLPSNGCTTEKHDGDTTVFSFTLWVPVLVLVGGVIAFFLGILIRRQAARWGWVLIVMGPLACVLLAPGLLLDKVTVNNERFTLRTGFWFAPTVHEVHFGDLSMIEVIAEERPSRRGTTTSYFLVCHKKSGKSEKVPIGDLMERGAVVKILQTAGDRGIAVIDKSTGE